MPDNSPSPRRGAVLAALVLSAALLAAVIPGGTGGAASVPTFKNYAAPNPDNRDIFSGEPTLGIDWATGTVMYQAWSQTHRVTFDDAAGTATWTPVKDIGSTFDPVLYTDPELGRTFVAHLTPGCDVSYTDDFGGSWSRSSGCGSGSGSDHPTIGMGPFASPAPAHSYPKAAYYCAQTPLVGATCALSTDGGSSFGRAVKINSSTSVRCHSFHGHVRFGPDGTVYVPVRHCVDTDDVDRQGVIVSTDNGATWTPYAIPGSTTQVESDPSVAAGSDGTVYFAYQNGPDTATGSQAYVAVSHDRGKTWTNIQDVSSALGLKNIQFPGIIAGAGDRAAYTFIGTTTPGDDQPGLLGLSRFPGVWHLYVALTYDGGASWTTINVTPDDPVQRGCISLGGTTSGTCRNLLDFMDITVDRFGRVLVAYADGCIGQCVGGSGPSNVALASIARQMDGPGLFAASGDDPPPGGGGSVVPVPSLLPSTGTSVRPRETPAPTPKPGGGGSTAKPTAPRALDAKPGRRRGILLTWNKPRSDGGLSLLGYRIYRGLPGKKLRPLAVIQPARRYKDRSTTSRVVYVYKIAAVNREGTGPRSNKARARAR